MYNLTQDVIDDLLAQQEAAIELAIKSVLSEGYLITDIATKGVFQKYPDGREIFIFNGKPLLEFGPCEVKIDESHKMTVSRSLKYLEDKC